MLTFHLFLISRTLRLSYYLTLRLHRGAFSSPLVCLLFAQILQLLTRVLITARCLFRQVSYLPFARLLGSDITWLRCLRGSCGTLIRYLQLLVFGAIVYLLDSHRPRQILFESRSDYRARDHRSVKALDDLPGNVNALAGCTRLKCDGA